MTSFIHESTNRLNKAVCQDLITKFENHSHLHVQGKIGAFKDTQDHLKKSTDIHFSLEYIDSEEFVEPLVNLLDFLKSELEIYKQTYPFLNEIAKWGLIEKFNMQRYLPGEGYYAWHSEYYHAANPPNTRMIAWMIYLNDVKDGGTDFADLGNVEAEEGKCVLWPAYWTHPHRGIVSETETKYIITGWYNFLD